MWTACARRRCIGGRRRRCRVQARPSTACGPKKVCARCLRCGRCDRHPDTRPTACRAARARPGDPPARACRRSARWWPSRCSCWPTRRSSGTSAPRSWPGSASPARCSPRRCRSASSSPTAPPRRSPAGSARATCARPSRRASTASGWRVGLGVVLAAVLAVRRRAARRRLRHLGRRHAVRPDLPARVAASACPRCSLVLAATGVLRGLQDTRTPLVVAAVGAAANVVLNLRPRLRRRARHRGLGARARCWRSAGMAAAFVVVVVRGARRRGRAAAAGPAGHPGGGPGRRPAGRADA